MRKHSFFVSNFRAVISASALAFLTIGFCGHSGAAQDRVEGKHVQSLDALAQFVGSADVVILGEVHDNPHHHQVQAELIAALAPKAVVWEMISPEQADLLSAENMLDAEATARILEWGQSGWPEFGLYAPVFQAAASAQQFGALVPRDQTRAALQMGVARHFGEDAARFGLDQPLPEAEQKAREADQLASHCNAMPADMLPMMVDFQRLRDTALAAAAERAWQQTGGPVVVITGNGHARKDRGVPVYLQNAAPDLVVLSLGQMEEGLISGQFDVTYSSPGIERPDPCLAFETAD